MRTLAFLVSIVVSLAGWQSLAAQDLAARIAAAHSDLVGWTIHSWGRSTFNWHGGRECCDRCSNEVLIAVRMSSGKPERVRLYNWWQNCDCDVDAEAKGVHLLPNVTPAESVDYLRAHLRDLDPPDEGVTAIALHNEPRVVPILIDLARHDASTKIRRQAIFWLGQRAGEKAAAELRQAIDNDPEEEVREQAVFAISQLPHQRSVPMLIDLVKTHKSRAVRKRAMFWLAQTNDPRALDLIEEILSR